ncbi:MAG TPA: hypothetical protein VHU23_13505 [Rhizomicrobium sp.]|nr:hypothetical protein [Rhizomicrobium sp.]
MNAKIVVDGSATGAPGAIAGILVGFGSSDNCYTTGSVKVTSGTLTFTGGLIGFGYAVSNSHSTASISITGTNVTNGAIEVGGVIGAAAGSNGISNSFATGAVTSTMPEGHVDAGGLVGITNDGTNVISDSYATGAVSATTNGDDFSVAETGGLVGSMAMQLADSYATGTVYAAGGTSGGLATAAGGLIGWEASTGTIGDGYWDTTTSGTKTGVGQRSESGVTGLTNSQFQAGLPKGFAPKIWREKKKINHGLPYLSADPPAR